MKYLILITALFLTFNAHSDQRCDMDTQNCHISLDPNDDDTEIDVPASIYSAQVNRYVIDGVRNANGSYHGFIKIPANGLVLPPLLKANSYSDIFTKGNANTRPLDDKFVVAQNTECNLVRSNFQENTGSDDQNQTQYTSNDWDLSVKWQRLENKKGKEIEVFTFDDDDFDLNEDGIVNFADLAIYKSEIQEDIYFVWYVAMNCRRGIAQ